MQTFFDIIARALAPRYLTYPMPLTNAIPATDTPNGARVEVSQARNPARFLKSVLRALRNRNRSAVVTLFVK